MILTASLMNNPAIVGLIVAIPSSALGYLGYRRARRNDEVAKQAGIATAHTTSIGKVVDGLNQLVDNLQEDNKGLRAHIKDLNKQLDRIISECQDLKRQVALLSQSVRPEGGTA